jgi:hypothetical protein
LCGFEDWFPELREEYRLKMYENRILRIIHGPKREEEGGLEKTAYGRTTSR